MSVRERLALRRGVPAKTHSLDTIGGEAPCVVRVVQYAGTDDTGASGVVQPSADAKWEPPRSSRQGGAPSRVRSASPARAARPVPERRASSRDRPRAAAISALSNCARSKIGNAPPLPPRKPGQVPKSMLRRKQELVDAKAAAEADKTRERIPAGYRKVDSEEQLDTLAILHQRKEQTEKAYSRLPLRLNTAAQRAFKEKLEQKLESTERLLKDFSKPKVLVPIDCAPMCLGEEDDECSALAACREPRSPDRGRVFDRYGDAPAPTTSTKVLGPPGGFSSIKLG